MKIGELARDWPPEVAVGIGDPAIAEPGDEVLSAQRYEGEKDHIRLKVRKKNGTDYTVILVLPEHLYAKAIIAIALAKDITLGELGELWIFENHQNGGGSSCRLS